MPESRAEDRLTSADGVVAVINTSPDIVDMLRLALERAGLVVVTAMTHQIRDGAVDLEAFVRQHEPRVVVYDIAPPYDANWQLFQHISERPYMKKRTYVLTSTSPKHVVGLAGGDQRVFEVVGRPVDIGEIVQATKAAVRARRVA